MVQRKFAEEVEIHSVKVENVGYDSRSPTLYPEQRARFFRSEGI
jgi:hypothetical protein